MFVLHHNVLPTAGVSALFTIQFNLNASRNCERIPLKPFSTNMKLVSVIEECTWLASEYRISGINTNSFSNFVIFPFLKLLMFIYSVQ
jgi:hypothetical protein